MDNPKIKIGEREGFGKALFAVQNISNDEFVFEFEGEEVSVNSVFDLPNNPPLFFRDHAVQFAEHKWRYSGGPTHLINHSCNPNCGIKGLFQVVALRNIEKGEELTYDYAMTEDSEWRMECKCGSVNCRSIVGAFSMLTEKTKEAYKGNVSDWLVEKYRL